MGDVTIKAKARQVLREQAWRECDEFFGDPDEVEALRRRVDEIRRAAELLDAIGWSAEDGDDSCELDPDAVDLARRAGKAREYLSQCLADDVALTLPRGLEDPDHRGFGVTVEEHRATTEAMIHQEAEQVLAIADLQREIADHKRAGTA